ncbi:MAG: aldo/keto reductase, partial [Planctomycetota bacterium]|nr:aldo/keto reductase [Planctomycetota bacterium]
AIDMEKQLNSSYSRRQFIGTVLAGTGALVAGPGLSAAQAGRKSRRARQATDIVTLGKTGIKTSLLAQGTGWNGGARSSAHTRLGEKEFVKLVRHSLDKGIRFMDMADLYGAHPYMRTALKGVPRDDYSILTKIWPREEFWNMPSGGAKAEVDRFRKELNSDVLEICLIHCMQNTEWPETFKRVRDELSEMKDKGAVKAVGVSCHDLGALKVAANHPWVDVVFARINNVGKEAAMDGSVEEVTPVLKQAQANGKVVIGMKIFGAGKLTSSAQKDASLKFVFENELVDAITIGMMDTDQVNDTIKRTNKALRA